MRRLLALGWLILGVVAFPVLWAEGKRIGVVR